MYLLELSAAPEVPPAALRCLLRPFVALLAAPGHAALAQRAQSALFQPMARQEEGSLELSGDELLVRALVLCFVPLFLCFVKPS